MRILIIESEHELREFLKNSFIKECFTVDTSPDGERGSFLARTNDYDALIIASDLPQKSGREICLELRQRKRHAPILILSHHPDIQNKVEHLNSGADDYMHKPILFEELLARLRAILRRPKQVESSVLNAGDLYLDARRHIVKRGNKEIYLTRKEFELLEYLMKNQGMVLSRGMIMEHVWDIHADMFSNTIETHILNLRRKLGKRPKQKLIHTIPARGYKFQSEDSGGVTQKV